MRRLGELLTGALGLLVACVLFSGCTLRLVADYDEAIDTGVTQLHRDTTAFLLEMERMAGTEEGIFENNRDFYVQSTVSVESLRLRASSMPKNGITTRALGLLLSSFQQLETAHEAQGPAGLNTDLASPIRTALEVHIGAILKLELAKKRGE